MPSIWNSDMRTGLWRRSLKGWERDEEKNFNYLIPSISLCNKKDSLIWLKNKNHASSFINYSDLSQTLNNPGL